MNDILLPFQLPHSPIRGRLVRLKKLTQTIATQHQYPEIINTALNELITIGLILASSFKYKGIFTLQVATQGPLRLMIVDITDDLHVRACARFDDLMIQRLPPTPTLQELCGDGHMAFTIDQPATVDRYQGIVTLSGKTFSECLRHYFQQSEQIETQIALFSQSDEHDFYDVGALFLQRMPGEPLEDTDMWDDMDAFVSTLSPDELLDPNLKPEDLLRRLFWEDGVQVFADRHAVAQCRCSQDKIAELLSTFQPADREAMVEDGKIYVICEFCNHEYTFDPF